MRPFLARGLRSGWPAARAGGGALALAASLTGWSLPALAQEILQAHVLDLSVLEVQVIVIGAQGDDQVRCLLRDRTGRARVAGAQRVATGAHAGRSAVVSVPLPVLAPDEHEFAVDLTRGDHVLDRTAWRRLFPPP